MNERGWTPPIVGGAVSASRPNQNHPSPPSAAKLKGTRSVSGSDTPLLSSAPSSSSSSSNSSNRRGSGGPPQLNVQTSPTKKAFQPSKPSPLSAGAASTAPKWGQMPFVSSQGHGGAGSSNEMDVLSTSPNSITPLNKHLDVTRSTSTGMLSSSSHGSGGAGGDRMSMVSEASRYSQAGPAGMSVEGHQVELGRQVSGEWGVAYDVESNENHSRNSAPSYGYGAPPPQAAGGANHDAAYGYEPEEVMRQQPGGAVRESGYLDEELESYYRPRSGI